MRYEGNVEEFLQSILNEEASLSDLENYDEFYNDFKSLEKSDKINYMKQIIDISTEDNLKNEVYRNFFSGNEEQSDLLNEIYESSDEEVVQ